MGDRNGRWAMIFDKGKVIYAEAEKSPGEVSVRTDTPKEENHMLTRF